MISTKIKEKEEAKQKYEDAVARGKKATLLEEDGDSAVTLALGNVDAGETVEVVMNLSQCLKVVNGSYWFNLPETILNPGSLSIEGSICSADKINYVSLPEGFKVTKLTDEKVDFAYSNYLSDAS